MQINRRGLFMICTNLLAVVASIIIIALGIQLNNNPENSCVLVVRRPVLILGALMLLLTLLGFVVGCSPNKRIIALYCLFMAIAFAILLAMIVFIVGPFLRGSGSEPVTSRAYQEYNLQSYSGWLRNRVRGPIKWARIQNCLAGENLCATMNGTHASAESFFDSQLNSIESGCCKPPTECGYTFVTPTEWISPIDLDKDPDCEKWSPDNLCFGCDSCKAGLLESLKGLWRHVAVLLLIPMFLWFVPILVAGWVLARESNVEKLFERYRKGRHTDQDPNLYYT